MKRSYFLPFVLMLLTLLSTQAQQTNNWYFGSAAGFPNTGLRIDFSSGRPVVSTCYPLMTEEGSSSISDASGNPLFYTDGLSIWDASTNTTFATGLSGGSSSSQSAIVMPKPGAVNQWLVFTSGVLSAGTSYYTVSGTPGSFTCSAGTSLVGAGVVGEGLFVIGSTKAGSSFWVIVRTTDAAGQVRAFDVSNTGVVNTTPVNSNLSGPGFTNTSYTSKIGTIKANTCQNKLAFTYLNGDVDLVSFNTTTGQVGTDARRITVTSTGGNSGSYGIEFSPNDAYLYITNLASNQLYRHDIAANTTAVFGTVTGEAGQLQLGPDGKIYMARQMGFGPPAYLGVINNPSLAGATFTANGLLLSGVTCGLYTGFSYRGLPTFPKSLSITNPEILPGDGTYCTNTAIPLSYIFAGYVSSLTWSYTGGGGTFTPGGATSTSNTPSITFTTTGAKTVTLDITDACSRVWSATINLTITSPAVPAGTVSCSGTDLILDNPASDPNEPNYIWYANSVATGNIIGTGTPVTYTVGNDASKPANICVGVGSSASTTTGTNKTIAGAATLTGASELTPKTSSSFDVLSDILVLKSFDVAFRFAGTYTFTVTIRNGASAVVFTQSYTTGAVGACSTGAVYTVNVNTSLPAGTGYTITITSAATIELGRGAWAGGTNAGEITYSAPAPGTNSFANLKYDVKDFTVTTGCTTPQCYPVTCTLPIEWSTFTVQRSGNNSAVLNWTTLSEINNDHFVIQRSLNGTDFYTIGTVAGRGNYVGVTEYEFVDEAAPATVAYYRIKQVDIDGQNSYSAIKSIEALDGNLVIVYPNPSAANFTVQSSGEQSLNLSVYDVLGREVYSATTSGQTTFGEDLPKGTYILKVQSAGSVQTIKIEKQ